MSEPVKLPGNLDGNRRLNQWLRFDPDRTVTVLAGKIEIGQGIVTALAQIAAEELDVDFARIRMAPVDTLVSANEGHTSASRSTDDSGRAIQYACAEARQLLLTAASRQLAIPAEQLSIEDGVISGHDRIRVISYWDLPHADLLDREATAAVKPKSPGAHRVVGTSIARLDIPYKVAGMPRFVHDMELPGMLFGRIVRPPTYAAKLLAFDADAVRALPGVVAAFHDGNLIGVVAEREEQAIKARQAVLRAARWQGDLLPTDNNSVFDFLQNRPHQEFVVLDHTSEQSAKTPAAQTLRARFTKPYLAHAALGPSCALARIEGELMEVWTHSQGVYPLRNDIATVLDVPLERVVVHHVEGAGCYGHNGADDAALDAVLLTRAVDGRPVQVQWMRDDEFAWEPYGPAMVIETQASLDSTGHITDWRVDVWSNGHTQRPARAKTERKVSALLSAWQKQNPIARIAQADQQGVGGMSRNATALYDFPRQHVVSHRVDELPLRASSMRSLGAYANLFAIESFMDDLALSAKCDPVEFRLRHMKDERARAVIELARRKAGWQAGAASDGTWGRGIGFGQYNNAYGYFAVVVEIGLEPDLHVRRAVGAVDVGRAINPDGIINQTEGGIVQAISWALKEELRFDRTGVLSRDWESYPVLGFTQVPQVEVHLINRPEEPPLGAGETTMGPTAAAIGNALHHALGIRVRDLPLTRERIAAAMA
jgi:CO/xanthine dehydrogenase Mo-binding subunit